MDVVVAIFKNRIVESNFTAPSSSTLLYSRVFDTYFVKIFFPVEKRFAQYPLQYFSIQEVGFILEGYLYDTEIEDLKKALIQNLITETSPDKLHSYLLERDGDFILHAFSNDFYFLFNDSLARLPLYIFEDPELLLISRNQKVLSDATKGLTATTELIGQMLWLGYTLSPNTLFKEVKKLQAGSMISVSQNKVLVNEPKILNLETIKKSDSNLTHAAKVLAECFLESTKNIASKSKTGILLSLSAGQDSRTVLGALLKSQLDFQAVSFSISHTDSEKETRIAKEMSKILHFSHQVIHPQSSNEHIQNLLELKMGIIPIELSYLLDFLEKLTEIFPQRSFFFTGDGGDKLLPNEQEYTNGSINDLVNKLNNRHSLASPKDIENLLGLSSGTLKSLLKNQIESYPEISTAQKSVHFSLFERALQLNFEGEDRNRYYFWSVSPFYTTSFVKKAMCIPDSMKSGYKLYAAFQQEISKEITAFKDMNGLYITSRKYLLKKYFEQWRRGQSAQLRREIKRKLKPSATLHHKFDFKSAFFKDNLSEKDLANYLSKASVESINILRTLDSTLDILKK